MTHRPLAALVLLLLLVGCDSVDDGPLSPGEFRATAGGAVEGRYNGEASFGEQQTPFDTVLSVNLKTGEYRAPGRTYAIANGIFLSVPWAGVPGSYSIAADQSIGSGNVSLPSSATYGVPFPYAVESGSVTVALASDERVEGTFDVVAKAWTSPEGATVRVQGDFVALPVTGP